MSILHAHKVLTYMCPCPTLRAAKMDLLDFYRQPQMQSFYRDHIKAIVSRVNTFNKM